MHIIGCQGWPVVVNLSQHLHPHRSLDLSLSPFLPLSLPPSLPPSFKVQKLLTMYSPANEYEDRVPASIIRLVAQRNGADSTDPAHLMASIDYVFPVTFPLSPSDVSYRNLALPGSLSHLDYLLDAATVY